MSDELELNPKQKQFVAEYLKDLNATQAAIRAGYKRKYATEMGYENLTKPHIQLEIQKVMLKRAKRTEISQDRVLLELAMIAFSDLQHFLSIDENTGAIQAKGFDEIPENESRVLKGIKENRAIKEDAKGEQVTVYDKVEFMLHDKMKALEMIGRHLGMFIDVKHGGKIILDHRFSQKELSASMKKYNAT